MRLILRLYARDFFIQWGLLFLLSFIMRVLFPVFFVEKGGEYFVPYFAGLTMYFFRIFVAGTGEIKWLAQLPISRFRLVLSFFSLRLLDSCIFAIYGLHVFALGFAKSPMVASYFRMWESYFAIAVSYYGVVFVLPVLLLPVLIFSIPSMDQKSLQAMLKSKHRWLYWVGGPLLLTGLIFGLAKSDDLIVISSAVIFLVVAKIISFKEGLLLPRKVYPVIALIHIFPLVLIVGSIQKAQQIDNFFVMLKLTKSEQRYLASQDLLIEGLLKTKQLSLGTVYLSQNPPLKQLPPEQFVDLLKVYQERKAIRKFFALFPTENWRPEHLFTFMEVLSTKKPGAFVWKDYLLELIKIPVSAHQLGEWVQSDHEPLVRLSAWKMRYLSGEVNPDPFLNALLAQSSEAIKNEILIGLSILSGQRLGLEFYSQLKTAQTTMTPFMIDPKKRCHQRAGQRLEILDYNYCLRQMVLPMKAASELSYLEIKGIVHHRLDVPIALRSVASTLDAKGKSPK